jgi:MarR family transcriptional regulator, transcriptional regulator for hemolysin
MPVRPRGSTPASRPAEGAFRELIRVIGLIERVMQPYFARFGISGSQWGVLRQLYRAEEEAVPWLRLTDLSDRLLIRPPSVNGVVDRLERAGLVSRDGSRTDLRAKRVSLTPQGRELVGQILAVHGSQIEAVLGGLQPAEQVELHRLLTQMSRHLEGKAAQALLTPA